MRASNWGSGLEGAPDIMLLTMSALMVAILWLAAQSHETSLPPIDLPDSALAGIGQDKSAPVHVTLRPKPDGTLEVFLEDERLEAGLLGLESALQASAAGAITLRADAAIDWEPALEVMSTAARLGMSVSVAVSR